MMLSAPLVKPLEPTVKRTIVGNQGFVRRHTFTAGAFAQD